jgi:hypothetical protein
VMEDVADPRTSMPVVVDLDATFAEAGEPEPAFEKTLPVAPFLTKLYDILSNDRMRPYIRWRAGGKSFVITDPRGFAARVLLIYWRHDKLRSFVRSLHMYGFNRIHEDVVKGHLCFYHKNFIKVCACCTKRAPSIGQ